MYDVKVGMQPSRAWMSLMGKVEQKEWGCRGGECNKSVLYKKKYIVTPSTFNNKYTPRKDN